MSSSSTYVASQQQDSHSYSEDENYALEDYWDIDAIIADGEKVPVIFKLDAEGLGYLEGYTEEHITAGTKLELPFWMVESLASNDFVELKHPKAFSTVIRRSLNASATHVNLHRLSPFFYTFGVKLADLIVDDDLNMILAKSFKTRLEMIMQYTQGPGRLDMLDFINTLDETEMQLYKIGITSHNTMRQWTSRALGKLGSAQSLQKPSAGGTGFRT